MMCDVSEGCWSWSAHRAYRKFTALLPPRVRPRGIGMLKPKSYFQSMSEFSVEPNMPATFTASRCAESGPASSTRTEAPRFTSLLATTSPDVPPPTTTYPMARDEIRRIALQIANLHSRKLAGSFGCTVSRRLVPSAISTVLLRMYSFLMIADTAEEKHMLGSTRKHKQKAH